jgi:hypothetical protein
LAGVALQTLIKIFRDGNLLNLKGGTGEDKEGNGMFNVISACE